jgi:chromosome segregation ATPase
MTDSELMHKMSKKIAQLTKVIFHLNTKNDEHQLYHSAQADAYEREVETIVNEANAIINRQKEILDRQRSAGDPAKAIAGLQQQFEEAKTQAQSEVAVVKRRADERVQLIERQANDKAEEAKREIAGLREAISKQLKQFEGKQLTSASALDDLRRAHAKEMDGYVKEQNARYNQLLKEKLDMEDSLKDGMAKALKKLNAEWEAKLQQRLNELRNEERERSQSLLDKASQSLLRREEELKTQIEILQGDKAKLEVTVQELQREVKKLNFLVGEWETKYTKLSGEYERLEADKMNTRLTSDKIGSELSATMNELQKLQRIIKEKDQKIENINKEYEDMMASFKREIAALKNNATDKENYLYTEVENLKQKVESLNHEVFLLMQILSEAREEVAAMKDKVTSAHREIEAEKKERAQDADRFQGQLTAKDQELAERDAEIKKLQTEVKDLKDRIEGLQANSSSEVRRLQDQLQKLQADHEAALGSLRQAHQQALEAQAAQQASDIEKLKAQQKDELAKQQSQHEYFCSCLKDEFTAKLNEQRAAYEEQIKQLQAQISNLSGESSSQTKALNLKIDELKLQIKMLEGTNQQTEAELARAKSTIGALNGNVDQLSVKVSGLEAEVRRLQSTGADQNALLNAEIARLKDEIKQTESDWAARLESELTKLRSRLEAESQRKEEALLQQIQELKRASEQSQAESARQAQDEINRLKFDIKRLQDEMNGQGNDWKSRLQSLEEAAASKLRDLESRHANTLEEQAELHKKALAQLNDKWELELQRVKAADAAALEAALKQAEGEKVKQISALSEANEQKLQKISRGFDELIAKKQAEFDAATASLKEQFSQELQRMKAAMEKLEHSLALSEADARRLDSELKQTKSDLQNQETVRRAIEVRLVEVEETLRRAKATFESEFAKQLKEFQDKELKLRQEFKVQRDEMIKENLEAMTQLQRDLKATTQMMEERYNELNRRFLEMQDMYDNRPSRDEDLMLIKHLQEEVNSKDEALRKAYDDMKFYKLELINREENYNKVFGATPNVGLINPLGKKKSDSRGNPVPTTGTSQRGLGMRKVTKS